MSDPWLVTFQITDHGGISVSTPEQSIEVVKREHVAFTIAGRNYLAQAIILHESLKRTNPNISLFTVLCDTLREELPAVIENATQHLPETFRSQILCLDELEHPSIHDMRERYGPVEFATSIKPTCFLLLARRFPGCLVSYLDPDIEAFGPFVELEEFMARHSITLMPHTVIPPEDEFEASALTIQKSGLFNFGYIGMNTAEPAAMDALYWWERRLEHECRIAHGQGIFVDQKWGNFFVCRPSAGVFLHPGYNVAYWNLHERTVSTGDEGFVVNGQSLRFFHYSGYDPFNPEELSKYQNRHVLRALPAVAALCDSYKEKLLEAGYKTWRKTGFNSKTKIQRNLRESWKSFGKAALSAERALLQSSNSRIRRAFRGKKISPGIKRSFVLLDWSLLQFPLFSRAIGRTATKVCNGLLAISTAPSEFLNNTLRSYSDRLPDRSVSNDMSGECLPGNSASKLSENSASRNTTNKVALAGYLTGEMGIGETGRAIVRALDSANNTVDLYDITNHYARRQHEEFAARLLPILDRPPGYQLGIVCVNADQLTSTLRMPVGEILLNCTKRVGYWFWETEDFPQRWAHCANYLDEVWVATKFVADAIGRKVDTPVRIVPPAIILEDKAEISRQSLALPDDKQIFVNLFDSRSFTERKNPLGLISAFRTAVDRDPEMRESALLVIKCTNMHPDTLDTLTKQAGDLPIRIVNRYFSRAETLGLMRAADCVVSLHRAEGLGLTMIEAMLCGKPTIATAYSGNMDFMNEKNSLLVKHRIVPAAGEIGPYQGSVWAEPDTDHAADQMIRILRDRETVSILAEQGRKDALDFFSPERSANKISEALRDLGVG